MGWRRTSPAAQPRTLNEAMDGINSITTGAIEKANALLDSHMQKFMHIFQKLIPAIIYSALFLGAGVIMAAAGVGQLIDFFTKISGLGFVIMGVLLIFAGIFYKNRLTKLLPNGK